MLCSDVQHPSWCCSNQGNDDQRPALKRARIEYMDNAEDTNDGQQLCWQGGLPEALVNVIPADALSCARAACKQWRSSVDNLITRLALSSLEMVTRLDNFPQLQELDICHLPGQIRQPAAQVRQPTGNNPTMTCPWCPALQVVATHFEAHRAKQIISIRIPAASCSLCLAKVASCFANLESLHLGVSSPVRPASLGNPPLASTNNTSRASVECGRRRHGSHLAMQGAPCMADEEGLAPLAHLCNLRDLDLSWCRQLADSDLSGLCNLTQLTSVSLAGCTELTDSGLQQLRGLSSLRHMDLTVCERITSTGLVSVLPGLSSLQRLKLEGVHRLTNKAIAALPSFSGIAQLSLKGCVHLTDEGLYTMAPKLPVLTHLDLCGCQRITDWGVSAVARHCPQLSHLSLANCKQAVNEDTCKILAAARLPLVSLNLNACLFVSTATLEALHPLASTLQVLFLNWCALRDSHLLPLAGLTSLRHLEIRSAHTVTPHAVRSLCNSLQQLVILQTAGCTPDVQQAASQFLDGHRTESILPETSKPRVCLAANRHQAQLSAADEERQAVEFAATAEWKWRRMMLCCQLPFLRHIPLPFARRNDGAVDASFSIK